VTFRRCNCCKRQPTCPFEKLEGEVIKNPSPEHCAVTIVDGMVHKYIKPSGDMRRWRERQRIASEHPDLFVPFTLVGRVVVQQLVECRHDRAETIKVVDEIRKRRIKVLDVTPNNMGDGRFIDFQVLHATSRVRKPRPQTRPVDEVPEQPAE
jgi:hypothetical protein